MSSSIRFGASAGVLVVGVALLSWTALNVVEAAVSAPSDVDGAKWLVIPGIVGAIAAAAGGWLLSRTRDAMEDLAAASVLGTFLVLVGIVVGASTAAFAASTVVVRLIDAAVALVAIVFAVLRGRMLRDEIVDVRAERIRIARLRDFGTRVRARVVEVEAPGVWVDGLALFHVAAEYQNRAGAHVVHERILLPVADAPVVDGTVLLWIEAAGIDPLNVFMEADPKSIRHPDPSGYLPAPAPESGGLGGGGA